MQTYHQEQILYMLKALADESRLTLLRCLYGSEHTVGDLAERVNLGEPTVSHHLTRLREAGFVTLRTAGNQRYYRVNNTGLQKFKQFVANIDQPAMDAEPLVPDEGWIASLGWNQ